MKEINKKIPPLMKWAKNRYTRAALALSLILGASSVSNAQLAINYPLTVSNGTYSSISSTGTNIAAMAADTYGENITGLPGFTVNGVTYNNARVISNGSLFLYAGTAPTSSISTPLSSAIPNGAVAISPLGADLHISSVATTAFYWQVIGNEIIFEWQNYSRYASGGGSDILNFQARLNTSTGAISFVYGTCTPGSLTSSFQVGWKTNAQTAANWATDVNNLMINVTGSPNTCTWENAVTGNANNSTMYLNTANSGVAPASGLTYTWTPPVTAVEPVRTFAAVTNITGDGATLSWTAPTGATSYNVQYRVPGSCTWTNWSGNPVSATTVTLTGLNQDTNYQARVQALNGTAQSIWSNIPTSASGSGTNGYTTTGTFKTILNCPSTVTALTSSAITTTTATIGWTAPSSAPANGYEYYYDTSSTAPTATTTPSGSVLAGVTTADLTLLSPATKYYFWVRTNCNGTDKGAWSSSANFTTLCLPTTIMFENFDTTATGNVVPLCWIRIVPATGAGSQSITTTTPASTPNNIYQYATTSQTPIVVVLPEFSNVNAGTHRLRLKARISSGTGGALTVGYVTDTSDASTFATIQTLTINNTTYTASDAEYTVIVPNTVPANARLAVKNASDGKSYYWDNVYWEVVPTCFEPTAVTASNPTPTTIDVAWTAPTTGTPTGYDVYYSTTNTAPNAGTVLDATNSVTSNTTTATINGLTPSTTYYIWVRTKCIGTDVSVWSETAASKVTLCQPPAILTTTPATVCPGNTAILSATADAGAAITWYDAATAGNEVGTGNSFTTPVLATTTDYWVSASVGSSTAVGVVSPAALTDGGTTTAGSTFYMEVTVSNNTVFIQSVDVFPSAAGQASTIKVYLGTGTTALYEFPFTSTIASGGVTPQTIPLNLNLSPGVYRFKIEGAGSYYRNYASSGTVGQSFPYVSGNFALTGGSNVSSGYYLFYNFIVGSKCESARTQVTATVDPAGCMGTSEAANAKAAKVYPNPFKDVLNISDVDNVKFITITDASGRIVKTIEKVSSSLNLSDLKEGLYLVNLNYKDGKSTSVKVIKK